MAGRWTSAFDALLNRARFERDLRDEVRQHLEARTRDLIQDGLAPAAASRQARVEFGAIERYKEECRDARGFAAFRPFHGLGGDVRLGLRRLAATPQFLTFAALSLAVGVGVTTAVYSILYSVVWRPIGFADPSRVVFIAARGTTGPIRRALLTDNDFKDVRDAQRTMAAVAAVRTFMQPLASPTATEFIDGEAVSGDYFRIAGVGIQRGRPITVEDDNAAAAVIVISDRTWRSRFEAAPDVVGRTVRFGAQSFEIIGVAAPGFDGIQRPPARTGAWVPLRWTDVFGGVRAAGVGTDLGSLTVIGRLADGCTAANAAADIAAIARQLDRTRPVRAAAASRPGDTPAAARPWSVRSADDSGATEESRVAMLVLVVVALVLGVACTNLANLMLARGALRQQEFAVRRALGASRWRLVRELFVEGALVACTGAVGAVLLLALLLRLASVEIPLPRGLFSVDPQLNVPALLMAAGALGLSMLVFGLEPAIQLTRGNVTADFAGGPAAVGLPRAQRQQAFIRWQVAVSAAFFLVAAILVNIIMLEVRHDSGVDIDRLGIATLHFGVQGWDERRASDILARVTDDLRGQRGIESVALASGAPFGIKITPFADLTTPDRPFVKNATSGGAYVLASTPEIFRTLGVPIVGGRGFDARDDAAAPRVAVLSAIAARSLFGTTDAVGRQVLVRIWRFRDSPSETYTVVGIAGDTDTGEATRRKDGVVYLPLAQRFERNIAIFARTAGDPGNAARAIQLAVRRADPDLGIGTAGAGSVIMAGEFVAARIAASFASALGLVTLIMSMVGLYGIQSHLVARRGREMGVRMAIGASAAQIKRLILREGYRPVLQGLALGLVFGALVRLLLRARVNGSIDAFDPIAFAIVPIPLLAAGFVACYLPARRAARADPNEALRNL